jgi:hypothetical protein
LSAVTLIVVTLIVAIQSAKALIEAIQFAATRTAASPIVAIPTAVIHVAAPNEASPVAVTQNAAFQIGFRVVIRAAPTSAPISARTAVAIHSHDSHEELRAESRAAAR